MDKARVIGALFDWHSCLRIHEEGHIEHFDLDHIHAIRALRNFEWFFEEHLHVDHLLLEPRNRHVKCELLAESRVRTARINVEANKLSDVQSWSLLFFLFCLFAL